jgi:hypothetical protein
LKLTGPTKKCIISIDFSPVWYVNFSSYEVFEQLTNSLSRTLVLSYSLKMSQLETMSVIPHTESQIESADSEGSSPDEKQDLESFTLFPKLPIELRLKIWRLALPPGRHVKMDLSHHFSESPTAPEYVTMKEDEHSPPITLYVNRESREETLRHYTVIFRTDAIRPTKEYKEKPFCLDPSRDSLYFFSEWLHAEGEDVLQFWDWMYHLDISLPRGFSSIRSLEYLDDRWGYKRVPANAAPPPPYRWSVLLPNIIFSFTGLTNLCVSVTSLDGFTYQSFFRTWLSSDQGKDTSKKMVEEWLDSKKEIFLAGKVPKLTFRSWQEPSNDWV